MLKSQKSIILKHLAESEHMAKMPFRFYVKKHKRQFIFGILCLLFTNALDALPPIIIGKVGAYTGAATLTAQPKMLKIKSLAST